MYPPRSENLDEKIANEVFGNFSFSYANTTYFDFKAEASKAILSPPRSDDMNCIKIKVICSAKEGDCEVQKKVEAGYFYLLQYPCNCGMLIVSNMNSRILYKRGLGTKMLQAVEMIAKDCGYSHISASTNQSGGNLAFNKMALGAGWKEIDSFQNKRSGSTISVLTKHIREGE